MIEAEWEDMRRKNSPRDIFIRHDHYFQLNLDETWFLCDEGELKIIGGKYKPRHEKIAAIQGYQLQSSGLGVQRVWMVQWYFWQRGQSCTLG